MLFSLKEIENYQLHAADGDFGKIKSFLVDDFEWTVRYLVAEVGSREVMLSVMAFGAPDPDGQVMPVNVSREKIMNSPTIDLSKPLSRDLERQLSDYYEWPYYWEPDDVPNTLPGDLTAIPLIDMQLDREQQEEEQEMIPSTGTAGEGTGKKDEFHLHSTKALFGETIHTTEDDHSAGKLVDFVTQDEDWNILYLVVDTGGLFQGKKVVVAPQWVEQIDELDSRIDVGLREDTVRNSPPFNSVIDLTQDYQSRLRDYYNQ